jgi:hypothetical protein
VPPLGPLQFRFNIKEVEMGTRRPLILCMVHDPSALEPRCRLQEEDSDDYSSVIPEASVAEAIRERTEVHLRKLGATVSSKVGALASAAVEWVLLLLLLLPAKAPCCQNTRSHLFTKCLQPIVMRAEFAYAPNLTIIDTPGFILKARQRRWCAGAVGFLRWQRTLVCHGTHLPRLGPLPLQPLPSAPHPPPHCPAGPQRRG